MRYTRNRQEAKARKVKMFNGGATNIKIVDAHWNHPSIDKSFRWHRECYPYGKNFIEIDDGESLMLIKSK